MKVLTLIGVCAFSTMAFAYGNGGHGTANSGGNVGRTMPMVQCYVEGVNKGFMDLQDCKNMNGYTSKADSLVNMKKN